MPKFYQTLQNKISIDVMQRVMLQKANDVMVLRTNEFINFPEHLNEDFQINVVPSAPPPLTINRKDTCYNKKSAIILPPEVLISCRYNLPSDDYYLITVSKTRFNEVFADISPNAVKIKPLSFPYSRTLWSNILSLFDEMQKKGLGYELMIQSKLTELIINLFREGRLLEPARQPSGGNLSYADRAIEYINAYYNADISLDDICRELNLSRYHFIRIFKEQTGKTPHSFLMDVRLEHALEHLRKNDMTLDEIACLCGFVNQIHFSQSFKKKYGVTPARYRLWM